MKYLLAVIMIFFFSFGFTQQSDSTLTYTEVVTVDGLVKDQLFVKGRQWFNDAWKSSKDVLQITDKETGELSGKGIISTYYDYKPPMGASVKVPVDFNVSISIYVKDGRYKYEFTNFKAVEGTDGMSALGILTKSSISPVKFSFSSQKKSDAIYQSLKLHLNERLIEMIATLKNTMASMKSKTDF